MWAIPHLSVALGLSDIGLGSWLSGFYREFKPFKCPSFSSTEEPLRAVFFVGISDPANFWLGDSA